MDMKILWRTDPIANDQSAIDIAIYRRQHKGIPTTFTNKAFKKENDENFFFQNLNFQEKNSM